MKFGKGKKIEDVEIAKPTEDQLYPFKEDYGPLANYAADHPLNTEEYKRKLTFEKKLRFETKETDQCFFNEVAGL